MGVIIRDSRGRFVATKAPKHQGLMEPHLAEAITVREGLKFAWELGIRALTLEGDTKDVFGNFESSKETFSTASKFHFF